MEKQTPPKKEQNIDLNDRVADSLRHESDEQLSSEEQQLHEAFAPATHSIKQKIVRLFRGWWQNKKVRYSTFAGLFILVLIVFAIPATRYASLNIVGVRGSLRLTVLDKTTQLPLQNVQVSIGDKTSKSSQKGEVFLSGISLGTQEVILQKNAFASMRQQVTITTGTTMLPELSLKAVGTQYTFKIVNYVTGKDVSSARLHASNDASANTDELGVAVLTLITNDKNAVTVTISADEYRDEKVQILPDAKAQRSITLVPKHKHIFASNQTGSLGVYSVDLDGKNRQEIMSTIKTGGQNGLQMKVSPDGLQAALVSKKDGITNKEGYLLDALTLLDVAQASNKVIDRGEAIQILSWSDKTIVYRLVVSGVSAANANRSKLMSYDTKTSQKTQLAAANYFSGEAVIDTVLYYALSSTDPNQAPAFMQVDLDGKNRQLLAKGAVWGLYRKSYVDLTLQNDAGWQAYNTKIHKLSKIAGPDYDNYQFIEADNGTRVLHVEDRDTKGVVVLTERDIQKEMVLSVQPSASVVLQLRGDVVIYRSAINGQIADYVVSMSGGDGKKITDTFNTY